MKRPRLTSGLNQIIGSSRFSGRCCCTPSAFDCAGECGKQQVHHSKYQGHVKGYDKEDRRPKQEHSRSNKYLDDNLMWGERVSGKLRAKMMVSGVSAETGSFAL